MKNELRQVEGFFDGLAERWDEISDAPESTLESLLDITRIERGHRVLDVGTGTGILLPLILKKVGKEGSIVALDVSREMLEKAREKFPHENIEFVKAAAEDIPLGENTFDHVIMFSCFPHLCDREQALREIARVLKKGGFLLIAHAMGRSRLNSMHKQAGSVVASHHLPPAKAVALILKEAGLEPRILLDEEERYAILAQSITGGISPGQPGGGPPQVSG